MNRCVRIARLAFGTWFAVGLATCFRSLDDLSSGRPDASSPAGTSPTAPPGFAAGGAPADGGTVATGPTSCRPALFCQEGVSCCETKVVPGGSFAMGPPAAVRETANPYEIPTHQATVGDFALDVYEVSVSRFRRFVSEYNVLAPAVGAGAHPRIADSGWQAAWQNEILVSPRDLQRALICNPLSATWTEATTSLENKPINCVTWYEAFLFCLWDGARLPTEAEWEYAAAGGKDWIFPWGSTVIFEPGNPGRLNAIFHCPGDSIQRLCTYEDSGDVGSRGPGIGRWGQLDLGGNMGEFTLDSFQEDWYVRGSCDNCANLVGDPKLILHPKVVRGGDYTSPRIEALYRFKRSWSNASSRKPTIGFRCAR